MSGVSLLLSAMGAKTIDLNGGTASRAVTSPVTATASYRLTSTGSEDLIALSTSSHPGINPGAIAPNYEARFTVNSGNTPSGSATGTYLALSSNRTWTLSTNSGTLDCAGTVDLRLIGDTTVLASVSVNLHAESNP